MTRNTILATLLLIAGSLSAQEKMISVFPAERELTNRLIEGKSVRMPDESIVAVKEDPNFVVEVTEGENPMSGHQKIRKAAEAQAGYLNPEGTLFLGYTPNGGNTFIQNPGVIGAWSYDLKAWKWRNITTGSYSSIDYENGYIARNPSAIEDGEFYSVDAQYNFYDTIMATGGITSIKGADADEGYTFQYGLPLQIVHRNGEDEKFILLTKYSDQSKLTNRDCKITAGGLPTRYTTDGLWPLTNAVSTNAAGQSTVLSYTDENKQKIYYFGTSKLGDKMPTKIITHYDKPQRQLYVKNITLMLGSNGTMSFDELHVDVLNSKGEIIAQSDATFASATNVNSPKGKVLNFYFEEKSAYGEQVSEGFAINEEFSIEISGMKEGDNFGIYSALSSVYESKSETEFEGGSTLTYDYDPYIMLYGIYPTLEDYILADNPDIDLGMSGDTVPIKFNLTEGLTYKYGATYAVNEEYNGISEFAFFSTQKPYDEDTRYWNLQIERPAYVTMSADYETHMNDDPEMETLWEYYRLFTLYIYADSKPVIGDCIKMTEYGKSIVFRIDAVMDDSANNTLARKLLNKGQLMIVRDGKTFNAQGLLIE